MKNELEQPEFFHNVLSRVVTQTGDNVMVTDIDGTIVYVNPAFENTTGYTKQEVIGANPRILQSGKHDKDYYKRLWTTILSGKDFTAQTTNKNKKGELYVADQTISAIKDESGKIMYFVSIWKDVTERVRNQNELLKLKNQIEFEKSKLEQVLNIEEHLNSIFELHKLIDFVVEKTTMILEAEKCSVMFVDEQQGELCIKGHKGIDENWILKNPLKTSDPIAGILAIEGKPVLVTELEKDNRFTKETMPFYKSNSFISVPIKLGESLIGVISVADKGGKGGVFTELDLKILCMIVRQCAIAIENAKIYRQLNYLTITDPITNLYNYRYFTKRLDYEISRLKRYEGSLCLIMIDIDNFKSYNDSFGHLEGDHLLKEIGKVFNTNLREVDIACRYAGDEFVLILPQTMASEAIVVAKKIKDCISSLKLKAKTTVSQGISTYHKKMDRADLIRKADRALYQAKKEGKNRICSLD